MSLQRISRRLLYNVVERNGEARRPRFLRPAPAKVVLGGLLLLPGHPVDQPEEVAGLTLAGHVLIEELKAVTPLAECLVLSHQQSLTGHCVRVLPQDGSPQVPRFCTETLRE